jgi:hypothetical protein
MRKPRFPAEALFEPNHRRGVRTQLKLVCESKIPETNDS